MTTELAPTELDATQQEALARCCDVSTDNRSFAVTGKAGTGKTSLMKRVYEELTKAGWSVIQCAPTGKAAKRIKEATGYNACTVHKLLEFPRPTEIDEKTGKAYISGIPKRGKHLPIEYDVVLCDEYAMVGQELHRYLMDAIPRGGAVRMFGDVNQLPPIEASEAFRKKPSVFEVALGREGHNIRLETIYRQGEGSGIVHNGDRILRGMLPQRNDEFSYQITGMTVDALRAYVTEARDAGINYASINHQIILPMAKGMSGTAKLNSMLQPFFLPKPEGRRLKLPRHKWAADNNVTVSKGDKIIWTKNNYDVDIFNGETGLIMEISDDGELLIDFGDREVLVPPMIAVELRNGKWLEVDPRRDISLAYALTTHKCQGSEFNRIIYAMNKAQKWLLGRANFYTAVTRAREHVHVIADQNAFSYSVWNAKRN